MKTFRLLLAVLLFSTCIYAQKTKTIVADDGNNFTDYYTIIKKGKIKHGPFVRLNQEKDTLAFGSFDNGTKIGIWHYNNKLGERYLVYNHTSNELLFCSDEALMVKTFLIKQNDAFVVDNVDRIPLFVGEKDAFYKSFLSLHLPLNIMENGKYGRSEVSFVIDVNGQIKDVSVDKKFSPELERNIIRLLNKDKAVWLPAIKNSEKVESKIIIRIDVVANLNDAQQDFSPYINHLVMVHYTTIKSVIPVQNVRNGRYQ